MSVSRHRAALLLGVLFVAALSSCSEADGKEAKPSAPNTVAVDVTGTFRVTGGPAPGIDKPLGGTVTFDGPVSEQVSAQDGTFTVGLPPGQYAVTGQPNGYFAAATCLSSTVTVKS